MEFDYDYMSVDRIPDNHLLLMHDVFVWSDYPQSETTKYISHVESKVQSEKCISNTSLKNPYT